MAAPQWLESHSRSGSQGEPAADRALETRQRTCQEHSAATADAITFGQAQVMRRYRVQAEGARAFGM
jgi:hypothetical protein